MKHARKFLFDIRKKEERIVINQTPHRIVCMRGCVTKFHDTVNHMKASYRQKFGHLTEFYKKRKTEVVILKKSRTEFFSKTCKAPITRKRKEMGIFYDLSEVIDLLDNVSSHEHRDLIVGKGDQGII